MMPPVDNPTQTGIKASTLDKVHSNLPFCACFQAYMGRPLPKFHLMEAYVPGAPGTMK